MLQLSCKKYIEENVVRSYRFLKWHCIIKPYDNISGKYFSQNSHGSIMLITCYYIICDSLGHILLSCIWILSVIISLKFPSPYLIKFMLFLDCLLLKLGVRSVAVWVYLCKNLFCYLIQTLILVLADKREPISVNT